MASTDTYPIWSGWQWRAYTDGGPIIGGWAPSEAEAERRAVEALEQWSDA